MRVFVTGATGVIGRRVVPILAARGHSVTAATRTPPSLEQPAVTWVAVDLFDVDALARAFGGHDAVINLATHMPSTTWKMLFRSAWRDNDRIRSEGAANVAAAAHRVGVNILVQESFALTYPDRGDAWIDEATDLAPADYNRTVLDAERAVAGFAQHGGNGVAVRFAAFYGPDAIQVKTYIQALRRGFAGLPGGPDRFISSVSHDDAAAAAVAAMHAPSGAYNVVDDEPVRRAEYFATLAAALHLAAPRFLPGWTTSLFGCVGETMARSLRLSNHKLRSATDWAPTLASVREGWRSTVDAMSCKTADGRA